MQFGSIMNSVDIQNKLLNFYLEAVETYLKKFAFHSEVIGADLLMDILYSYAIRKQLVFNSETLNQALVMFESEFVPVLETQEISATDALPNYKMGVLYVMPSENQFAWIGSSGQFSQKRFDSLEDAQEEFRRELHYQWLNLERILGLLKQHQMLLDSQLLVDRQRRTLNFILYYLDYRVLDEVWDTPSNIFADFALTRKFTSEFLASIHVANSPANIQFVINYLQFKTDMDINAFGLKNFYKLCSFVQNLSYVESDALIFPRFLVHNEIILLHALNINNTDFELDLEYQGELMQYFVWFYPYVVNQPEWTCANAKNLLDIGRLFRSVLHKHLGLNIDEEFNVSDIQNISMSKETYLAIMQDLPASLRLSFFKDTVEHFKKCLKDKNCVEAIISLIDPHLLELIEQILPQEANDIYKWVAQNSFEKCKVVLGENVDMIINHFLLQQGYIRVDPHHLDERHMLLAFIFQLNNLLSSGCHRSRFSLFSSSSPDAVLWLKSILFYPEEYSTENFNKYKKHLNGKNIEKIVNSPVFERIKMLDFPDSAESKPSNFTLTGKI